MNPMLGVILAGGQSRRFGSDKALALFRKKKLIDHARAEIGRWCQDIVIVGRQGAMADWPAAGFGPLGGMAAAFLHAKKLAYDDILVISVDTLGLPEDFLDKLSPGPSYVEDQPVIGLWPVRYGAVVQKILQGSGPYSLRALVRETGARGVRFAQPLANINRPEDLVELEKRHGL